MNFCAGWCGMSPFLHASNWRHLLLFFVTAATVQPAPGCDWLRCCGGSRSQSSHCFRNWPCWSRPWHCMSSFDSSSVFCSLCISWAAEAFSTFKPAWHRACIELLQRLQGSLVQGALQSRCGPEGLPSFKPCAPARPRPDHLLAPAALMLEACKTLAQAHDFVLHHQVAARQHIHTHPGWLPGREALAFCPGREYRRPQVLQVAPRRASSRLVLGAEAMPVLSAGGPSCLQMFQAEK